MKHQQGSIFFYILLAVALFAALGFALSRGTGGQGLSQERADILAGELIQQGNMFRDAVARVRANGFSKFQISFENSVQTGYTNPNCTSPRCRIFSPSGGGLEWMNPPPGANSLKTWAMTSYSAHRVGRDNGNPTCSLSRPCTDLAVVLPNIPDEICRRINVRANIGNIIPTMTAVNFLQRFVGAYIAVGWRIGNDLVDTGNVNGRLFYCVRSPSSNGTAISQGGANFATPFNVFYYVLLPN